MRERGGKACRMIGVWLIEYVHIWEAQYYSAACLHFVAPQSVVLQNGLCAYIVLISYRKMYQKKS